jgi:hypothetical protein
MSKLAEIAIYGAIGVVTGYVYRDLNPPSTGWVRPKGWVGYYPSSSGEALAHPCRSPYCDANHQYPCPKKECRGYQGPT